jgi:hypothetical protein
MHLTIPVFAEPVRASAGSYKKWINWRTRFTALLENSGVAHMLTHKNELNGLMNDAMMPASAPMTALMKANAMAWYLLVTALSGEPFDLIRDLPNSHVGKAWELLTAKYEKDSVSDLPYLMAELFECKWRSTDVDPSIWLADMRAIIRRIVAAGGCDKTDAEWIALIQSNTEISEFQQLYTFLNVTNKTRKADWESEICKMWNNRFRRRWTVPAAHNNNVRVDVSRDAAYLAATASQNEPPNTTAMYENRSNNRNNNRQPCRGRTPNSCSQRGAKISRPANHKASHYAEGAYQGAPRSNNSKHGGFGESSRPLISRQSNGKSDFISREQPDRKTLQRDYVTANQHEAAGLYYLGSLAHREIAEGPNAENDFNRGSANSLSIFKPELKAPQHKPSKWVTPNGHCKEYCPAKLCEGLNKRNYVPLFNNQDEAKDYWKELFKDDDKENVGHDCASERYSNAPQVFPRDIDDNKLTDTEVESHMALSYVPVHNVDHNITQHILEDSPAVVGEKKDEDENVNMSRPEDEKLFGNQEQSVPPVLIEVGRKAEDPSDDIISPADKPAINHRKTSESVITSGRRTKAQEVVQDETLNNISPLNEVGRNKAGASPESLSGTTSERARQKLRDLRAAVKIRLDNYVRNEMGNLRVNRTQVAASTQSISTHGLAQARQKLRDLRTDIKVKLDDFVRRVTGNLQSLQHLSGTESTETPPITLGQVQTSRYKTLKQPKASNQTPTARLRHSRQRTHSDIRAHFVFDRGKMANKHMNQLKKLKRKQ